MVLNELRFVLTVMVFDVMVPFAAAVNVNLILYFILSLAQRKKNNENE